MWPVCPTHAAGVTADNALLPVPARTVDIGKKTGHRLYGWDSEYGSHSVDVPAFQASQLLVSNEEYLEFVKAGGYDQPEFWTDEGWRWRNYRKAKCPVFWVAQPDHPTEPYRFRNMTNEQAMPWNWPAEVNQLEAKAFCNWRSARTGISIRLPTEEEWASLRLHTLPEDVDIDTWAVAPGNINLEHWCSSVPVDTFKFEHGFYDVIGNVWQWTETPVDEFSGFRVHPVYDDFSVPTFDTRHNMIKGGSWISTGNSATFHGRYAFRRHFFQHAGFRFVQSDAPLSFRPEIYERDEKVVVSLEAHYGPEYFGVPNFSQALANHVIQVASELGVPRKRVLDMGCASGRATFELARQFEYALGLDFSTRFFRLAVELQKEGCIRYALRKEASGDMTTAAGVGAFGT